MLPLSPGAAWKLLVCGLGFLEGQWRGVLVWTVVVRTSKRLSMEADHRRRVVSLVLKGLGCLTTVSYEYFKINSM